MSGGVDSSVAAATLVDEGYDVTGIMLKLWRGDCREPPAVPGCCSVGAAEDARRVADVLGIPFYVLNLTDRFEDSVIKDFHGVRVGHDSESLCALQPVVKFDALFERAMALGADVLATGHYARVGRTMDASAYCVGHDGRKDQ